MPELQRRRKRYQVVLELTSIVATRCGQPVMDRADCMQRRIACLRRALRFGTIFDPRNFRTSLHKPRSKQGLSTDYLCMLPLVFRMSAYAERLASHSRNSLSKTESTLKRDGWQESNFGVDRNGTGGRTEFGVTYYKGRPVGGGLCSKLLMASHWPPENAPGGKRHSIRRPHLLWVLDSFG